MKYRPEIDGLRAFAIIPVVVFHSGLSVASGGFVGVDIFFVISGYLITKIIHDQIVEGRFSYVNFYERRIRRIMPALVVVVVTTLAASYFVSLPEQLLRTATSSFAAIFAVSNIYFWSQSGYFAPDSEFLLLLHTWSLGVEEQFYLFLPPLLILLLRIRLGLKAVLFIGLPLAFLASLWLSFNKPSVAFYLLPARAWELGLGSALAIGLAPRVANRVLTEGLAVAGLIAIVASVFLIDSRSAFPGFVALAPCLGTAAIIHFADRESLAGRLLSIPPLRFIGLISYSLYLWHWPVFVLMRMVSGKVYLDTWQSLLGIAVATGLAALSWKFVELPFRSSTMRFPRVGWSVVLGTVAAAVLAVPVFLTGGWPSRLDDSTRRIAEAIGDTDAKGRSCIGIHSPDKSGCIFGKPDAPLDFVLIGDSHAGAIRPTIEEWALKEGRRGTAFWRPGCQIMLDAQRVPPSQFSARCEIFKKAIYDHLEKMKGLKTILVAGRWEGVYSGRSAEVGGSYRVFLVDSESQDLSDTNSKRVFEQSLLRTARKFGKLAKEIVFVGSVPEIGFNVPTILSLNAFHNHIRIGESFEVKIDNTLKENVDTVFRRIAKSDPAVRYVSLWRHFCAPGCKLLWGGIPVYSDDDHISYSAAKGPVAKAFIEEMKATE